MVCGLCSHVGLGHWKFRAEAEARPRPHPKDISVSLILRNSTAVTLYKGHADLEVSESIVLQIGFDYGTRNIIHCVREQWSQKYRPWY